MISTWKHTEDKSDEVEHSFFTKDEIKPLSGLLTEHTKMRFIFNDKVFTSMDYWDGHTKRWANLSKAEKDAVFYLQKKFDLSES